MPVEAVAPNPLTTSSSRGTVALRWYAAAAAGIFFAVSGGLTARADAPHWVGSWMASPCAADDAEPRHDQFGLGPSTVRQIVHLSIGGVAVRIRLSNTFGTKPLVIRSMHVAPRVNGSQIALDSDKPALFGGKPEVTIAPGASVMSDTVSIPAVANTDLAVSFFVPEKVVAPAIHYTALQTSYVADGDQTAAETLKGRSKTTLDLIVTGVDVATRTAPGAIVALGSSTTDGAHSTLNANHRWTDFLEARLRDAKGADAPSVLNAGISGNKVLHDGSGSWGPIFGQSALARFTRDVLVQSGVTSVITFEGGNDFRDAGGDAASAHQLIMAYQLLAQRAHQRKLKFIVGTITPFGAPDEDRSGFGSWEETRMAVNQWIRTSKEIDGFVDFDVAIRNPQAPDRMLPMYDSGDHLHPNDSGYKAMAESIDLKLFQ